jgi:hypothetical protein
MELYCTPKVNTLQLNTVGNSSNTRRRPTRTVSEQSLLKNASNTTSCGNLPTLTPIIAVIKLPNTHRVNPSSGYRSTCTPQRHFIIHGINSRASLTQFPDTNSVFQPKGVRSQIHTSAPDRSPDSTV